MSLEFLLFGRLSIALLAGGHARKRNPSAWNSFLLTFFLGPLAVFMLITWPSLEHASIARVE